MSGISGDNVRLDQTIVGTISSLKHNRKDGNEAENEHIQKIIKRLCSINFKFETELIRVDPGDLWVFLTGLTEGTVNLLALFKIKNAHNPSQISDLKVISEIGKRHNDFREVMIKLKQYWEGIVDKHIRDITHMAIFIRLFDKFEMEFFELLVRAGIKLSSSDMQHLEEIMKNYSSNNAQEFFDKFMGERGNEERKFILFLSAKTDHNLASRWKDMEMDEMPKDHYVVEYAFVSSPAHLAVMIKDASSRKKIDVLIIEGHGSKGHITFSDGAEGRLTTDSLNSDYFKGVNSCFSKDAVCYLLSCSTGGGEDPIAQHFANVIGVPVYGPHIPAATRIEFNRKKEIIVKYFEVNADKTQIMPVVFNPQ
ncbi:MAG: hypothetical protein QF915_00250 [Candidatus Woesearchaeota archaeon]|jgi:hypothetical protein|nr:hypothetical protein [Candidatus Woesearchaeota archaeon]MDP7457242.1 hypothetical protein [Candidatus Woesearchaeota archaeon]